jgi:hypothetical protein
MYSTSCYKERLTFENTLYKNLIKSDRTFSDSSCFFLSQPYNMIIGYDICDCFTIDHFSIASKNDIDDQNLLLATVHA